MSPTGCAVRSDTRGLCGGGQSGVTAPLREEGWDARGGVTVRLVLTRGARLRAPAAAVGVGPRVVGAAVVVRHRQAEELIKAVRARQKALEVAEVPLACHRRGVARLLEQRRDGRLTAG